MARLHLFEFHDLPRCPPLLRRTLTELLERGVRSTRAYEPAEPLLVRLLEQSGSEVFLDLCSGGGGPWGDLLPRLRRATGRPLRVVLSDLYPDLERFRRHEAESNGGIGFEEESVDATEVPARLAGVRTIFSSFHHFPPALARGILADAARSGVAIGVFEGNERSVRACAAFLVGVVPAVLLWTLALRPVSWRRLLWTYAVPVYPAVMLWDALVSNLRAYTPAELEALVAGIDAPGYRWEVGCLRGGLLRPTVTYVIGAPGSG
ncbi:MAG: class I SAM-dependent methyltransferase [Planctomycetota bacterium]